MPECFSFKASFNFAENTINQTTTKAIIRERHYGNENGELVRSLSFVLRRDSGQGFSADALIEGGVKDWVQIKFT